MPVFLKQLWSNTISTLPAIWENNLETFEKLFCMIQSGCSIYSYFLKPLHWNIHELWHKTLLVMKITVHFFLSEPVKLDPRLSVLKFSWFLGCIVLNLVFSPDFLKIFLNTVVIYNTRNRSNNTTESQKEKTNCFNAHAVGKRNLTFRCIVSKQITCGH